MKHISEHINAITSDILYKMAMNRLPDYQRGLISLDSDMVEVMASNSIHTIAQINMMRARAIKDHKAIMKTILDNSLI